MEAIEFESGYPDAGILHKSYLKRREGQAWRASTESGIPMALSNYSPNAALMGLLMDRAATAEEALEIFKEHAYKRFTEDARVI